MTTWVLLFQNYLFVTVIREFASMQLSSGQCDAEQITDLECCQAFVMVQHGNDGSRSKVRSNAHSCGGFLVFSYTIIN